jgi:transposase
MSKFRDIDNSAVFKQMPDEDECLPIGHLARFILGAVKQMNLSAFEDEYVGSGSKPYAPATFMALFIYGYITRTFSSRKIEAATYDSIAFRFLAGNTHPDHSSLAEFRRRFQGLFKDIFKQVLLIAHQMGLMKKGIVAGDGTKIHANASKHSALSYGHALKLEAQLEKEIDDLLAEAAKADSDNRQLPMGLNVQNEVDLRKDLLSTIVQAKAEIERRAKERDVFERAQYEEKLAKYKAKMADKQAQRLAWEAANVEKAAKRAAALAKKELKRQAQATQAGTVLPAKKSGMPQEPVAGPRASDQVNLTDKESRIMPVSGGGFEQCYNPQAVVAEGTMLVVAAFVTQATNDQQQAPPMLKALSELPQCLPVVDGIALDAGFHSETNVDACYAAGIEPLIAARREHHHPSPMERFTEPPPLPDGATPVEKMAHKLKTMAGKKLYALRKQTVEPVFGIIKSIMGFRQFSMRGLVAADNEWNMVCLAWNLKRMAVLRLK